MLEEFVLDKATGMNFSTNTSEYRKPAIKNFFYLIPVFLSLWMLGAHFLRAGQLLLVLLALITSLALFIRRPWIARMVQFALIAGTIEWIRALVVLVLERQSYGMPWLRLAFIMGSVILLAISSIFVLQSESLRKRYKCQ